MKRRYGFEVASPVIIGNRSETQPTRIPARWVLTGLGLLAVVALVAWVWLDPRFYVQGAQIVGAARVASEAVYDASHLDHVHTLWVDESAAEASILEQLPSVERADVACGLFTADCTIAIAEWPLVANWYVDQQVVHIDRVGNTFPAAEPLAAAWDVSGPLPIDEQGRLHPEVLQALDELERLTVSGPFSYEPSRGLVMTDDTGWRVILGQGPGMALRLRVYARVRDHLLARGVQPRFVDVRFPEAPYYSETNDW
jgi:cell division septal protein FtsQ